jgi:hypothetical protein
MNKVITLTSLSQLLSNDIENPQAGNNIPPLTGSGTYTVKVVSNNGAEAEVTSSNVFMKMYQAAQALNAGGGPIKFVFTPKFQTGMRPSTGGLSGYIPSTPPTTIGTVVAIGALGYIAYKALKKK